MRVGKVKGVTHAMEDYLKAIYRIEERGQAVSTQHLANELAISGASVTNMIKRLAELKLVDYSKYRGVTLTEPGRKVALEVIRHHRLLELYLSESLGMPWHEVHAEAERLEHHLSDELEARMDSALGFPTHDPHGDPIPTPELTIENVAGVNLAAMKSGQSGVVTQVSDRNPE
ncbi:MAG: metal-dependent transcriptional regulator, partial [Chloroflexota bacterium]|nr:metal-dependent transcriptional regulator [Chloroflexota bacterium]